MFKKYSQLAILATSIFLSCLITHVAVASNDTKFLPSVIYLLQGGDDEFGSLLPGKLYSSKELSFWRARAKAGGPHVIRGDVYGNSTSGSIPDYSFVKYNASVFNSVTDSDVILEGKDKAYIDNLEVVDEVGSSIEEQSTQVTQAQLDAMEFSGDCVVIDWHNGATTYGYWEFGDIEKARDAAFVDLIEGTSVHTQRIKNILVAQAQEPCMDFSNREIFKNDIDQTGFWFYLEWLHRVLKTYDYLDESAFTVSEKNTIEEWFKAGAEWAYYFVSTYRMAPVYDYRASNPINSKIDLPEDFNPENTGYWLNRPQYAYTRIKYKDSSVFWAAGSLINNREVGQLNYVVHAGVKFGINKWKREGAQLFKEYISFHFDDEGYFAELERSNLGNPNYGIAYGMNTLLAFSEIAHVLYLAGYENLFEYKSKARINEESGEIETGSVEKSLEWVFLKFRENFMLSSSSAIYPKDTPDDQENTDLVIHFCNNTSDRQGRYVGRMYSPAAIANRYYKNPLIKEMYNFNNSFGNMCRYHDTEIEIRVGPHLIIPATLFQYSDADENY